MKNALFALLALGMAGTASADAINSFTWDTWSSDDKMYVCNVGITHRDGTQGHVDVNSGGEDSGNTMTTHDYATVTYATLNNDMERGAEVTKTIEASTGGYVQLFADAAAHGYVVTSLQVNLSSENYGAKYFVDVCYRGVQIDYAAANINSSYVLKHNQLTYTDHGNASEVGRKYFSEAVLVVDSDTTCDTQLSGSSRGPGNGLAFVLGEANVAAPAGDVVFNGTRTAIGRSGQVVNFVYRRTTGLNGRVGAKDAPKYCKTRYSVEETRLRQAAIAPQSGVCAGTYYRYTRRYAGQYCAAYSYRSYSCGSWASPRTCYTRYCSRYENRYVTQDTPYTVAFSANYTSTSQCLANLRGRSDHNHAVIDSRRFRAYRPGQPEIKEPRNWTRMGGQFTALTEIENHGQQ